MHTVTGSRQRIANEFGGAVECKSRKMKKKQDCGVHIIPSGELVEHQGGARQVTNWDSDSFVNGTNASAIIFGVRNGFLTTQER